MTSVLLRLRASGCVFAEDEARLLCEHARDQDHLDELVERRVAGEPLEHLIGWVEFCGRGYFIGPGVFIPRQRSSLLVDVAAWIGHDADGEILDLCCGVGALGIAVRNRIGGRVIGADLSPDAVAYAIQNGIRDAYVGDLFEALPGSYRAGISVLIANVPYVPRAAITDMPRESRDYEPRVAVDGGIDGMDLQRRVLTEAGDWLAPGGWLFTETSAPQARAVLAEAIALGWNAWVIRDEERGAHVLAGHRPVDNAGADASCPQPRILDWIPLWAGRRFRNQGKGAIVALAEADIERRIAQNTDDIFELYSITKDIQKTVRSHTKRLDRIDERLDGIDGRLDGLDQRMDGLDRRMDGLDRRMDGLDQRMDSLVTKVDEVLRRLPS